MKNIYNLFLIGILSALGGCSDDFPQVSGNGQTNLPTVEAYISLSVNDFSVSSAGTRDAEPTGDSEEVSEGEKRIENIWVFQYDTSGNILNSGKYYSVSVSNQLGDIVNSDLKVELVEGESTICIIANTSDESWGNNPLFNTYSGLKGFALPNPEPIFLDEINSTEVDIRKSIPMEGEKSALVGQGAKIIINVTRMFAKLKISFGDLELAGNDKIAPKSIEVNNIPHYCRVETLGKDLAESAACSYEGVEWITRAFNAEAEDAKTKDYVLYVPENIQGEVSNNGEYKGDIAPAKALGIKLTMTNTYQVAEMGGAWFEEDVQYNIYPGGNNTNNFNVRRNNVYRLKTNIRTVDVHNPSSNCFVVVPGENLAFEPYYRTEIGGVEDPTLTPSTEYPFPAPEDPLRFENYLNPNDPDKTIKRVEIIWQDEGVIGDNTAGKLVNYELNETEPYHSKIYVRTSGKEGNALIGAFNEQGDILWSWHIWIAAHEPSNVGKAVIYTTYDWDSEGIKTGNRIPGYAVMSCNLGALADVPTDISDSGTAKTYGMLYQWGRKDPFPPMIKRYRTDHDYNEESTGIHYDNSNQLKVDKTGWDASRLTKKGTTGYSDKVSFYSILATDNSVKDNSIKYSIAHPCTFICGTKIINVGSGDGNMDVDLANQEEDAYNYNGDWLIDHNAKLWGGLDPTTPGLKQYSYKIIDKHEGNHDANIFNNYGTEKSIFDPCPSGWRVPPGDLWLGFSKTGLNPESVDDINYNKDLTGNPTTNSDGGIGGMYMYMTKSKWDKNGNEISNPGRYLFFPTQGSREGSGNCLRVSWCGNYHNATTDINDRVNVLHIHNGTPFKIFESFYSYTVKSMGAPIRCVRDRK